MGIQSRLIVLLLFVALSASGWGSALPLCVHLANAANAANQTEDHACCPTGHANQESHCKTSPNQTADVNIEALPDEVVVNLATTFESSFQIVPTCGRCLDRPVPIPAYITLREKNQKRRAADALPTDASQLNRACLIAFKPPVISRQGAPPGVPTPNQILLSIFLI